MTAARRDDRELPWFLRRRTVAAWCGFELVTIALGAVVWPGVLWLTTAGLLAALATAGREGR